MKDKIIPIASVVIGLLAFFLSMQFLKQRQADYERDYQKKMEGLKKVVVVAARREMVPNTFLTVDSLKPLRVFAQGLPRDYVKPEDVELVVNRRLIMGVDEGQPLCWSYLEGGSSSVSGLARSLPTDLRAISISVGGPSAVSGLVRPNDRVDILGTFAFPSKTMPGEMEMVTLTVLQDVSVLATGQTMANDAPRNTRSASGYSMVTLAVSIEEAELLTFAQQTKGRLTLALRHPDNNDAKPDMPTVDFEYLQHELKELNRVRQEQIRKKRPGSWDRKYRTSSR